MKLQILGTGCMKCDKLEQNAKEAIKGRPDCEIEKIKDLRRIMDFGVMLTPALAIDGQVKSVGKVLSVDEIKKLL